MIATLARSSLLALACLLSGLGTVELSVAEPVAEMPREAVLWEERMVDGVSYVSWAQLCEQYSLSHVSLASLPQTYRHRDFDLRLSDDGKSVYLQGFKVDMMHPILFMNGKPELISKADCVQLIDPILRPNYIEPARPVDMVLINAPYGGMSQGGLVQTDSKTREASYTLKLAARLKARLNAKGVPCELVRKGDRFLSDQARVSLVNGYSNAIYISLHVNDGHPSRSGVECYTYRPSAPHSALLGMSMLSQLVQETGAADGGLRGSYFSILRSIRHPACILYLGYSSHEEEGMKLLDMAYQEKMITAMENGILNYIRLSHLPRAVELDREWRMQEVSDAQEPSVESQVGEIIAEPESAL